MEQYDIRVHNAAEEELSFVVIVLLIIFFPIGIIVFIARQISKLKKEKSERILNDAHTGYVVSDTELLHSKEILAYHDLYVKGILTKEEYEAKKNSILNNTKLRRI